MKAKFLIALVFTLASVLFFAENLQAQKLISGDKPKQVEVEGFDEAACINLTGGFRVCKTKNYEPYEGSFIIQENKNTLGKIDAPLNVWSGIENFYSYRGDLDKDNFPEIVVVSLESIGNGIGISQYNVYIFKDPVHVGFQKPLILPIEEFGAKGNFIYDKRQNETQILLTYWKSFDNLDLKRGYGTYLVGKWFRYQNGLLKPVFEKPTLARRFLNSFAGERNATSENPYAPYLWLKSKNTHEFFAEPKEISKLVATQYGTIKGYEQNDEIYERRLIIKSDSGALLKGVYTYNSYGDKKEPDTLYLTDIGLGNRKYFFPFDFTPSLYFEKIEGKRVKLETYKDEYSNEYTKLSILE